MHHLCQSYELSWLGFNSRTNCQSSWTDQSNTISFLYLWTIRESERKRDDGVGFISGKVKNDTHCEWLWIWRLLAIRNADVCLHGDILFCW